MLIINHRLIIDNNYIRYIEYIFKPSLVVNYNRFNSVEIDYSCRSANRASVISRTILIKEVVTNADREREHYDIL